MRSSHLALFTRLFRRFLHFDLKAEGILSQMQQLRKDYFLKDEDNHVVSSFKVPTKNIVPVPKGKLLNAL
jgi:hypothetical protein